MRGRRCGTTLTASSAPPSSPIVDVVGCLGLAHQIGGQSRQSRTVTNSVCCLASCSHAHWVWRPGRLQKSFAESVVGPVAKFRGHPSRPRRQRFVDAYRRTAFGQPIQRELAAEEVRLLPSFPIRHEQGGRDFRTMLTCGRQLRISRPRLRTNVAWRQRESRLQRWKLVQRLAVDCPV